MSQPIIVVNGPGGKKTIIIPQQQQQMRHQPIGRPMMAPMVQQPRMMHQPPGHPHMMAQPMMQPGQPMMMQPGQPQMMQPGQPQMMQPQQPMMMQPGQPMMQPQQPMMMQPGQPQMMQPQGYGAPPQFNKFAGSNPNYTSMNGFSNVDYSGGWNPNVHDSMLKSKINQVYMMHDANRSGQLEGQEFFYAYRDLCLGMGMCPPQSLNQVWGAALKADTNGDGVISRMEMFMLFKNLQGISPDMQMSPNMNMGW